MSVKGRSLSSNPIGKRFCKSWQILPYQIQGLVPHAQSPRDSGQITQKVTK